MKNAVLSMTVVIALLQSCSEVCALGSKSPELSAQVRKSVLEECTLKVPFGLELGSKLVIGDGSDDVVETPPSRLLFLKSRKHYRGITMLNNRRLGLAGFVKIRSKTEALSFARLLTSPATMDVWDDIAALEVCSRPNVGSYYLFGAKQTTAAVFRRPEVRTEKELRRYGMFSPKVRRQGNTYRILRWLLLFAPRDFRRGKPVICAQVKELVGYNGSYTRYVLKCKEVPREFDWNIIPGM